MNVPAEARVKISVQTEGKDKVDALEAAVRDLTRQTKDFARQAGETGNAASQFARQVQQAATHTTGVGKSAGLAGYQMQNLAYQLNDVVVGLTSGQKPMTVFMQQGSQIGQIMGQAGVGVGGLAKQVGGMALEMVAAHPVLAALAAAAGIAAAAVGLMTAEINENSAVHVTWKDTLLGTYDLVKAKLTGELTEAFQTFGISTADVWGKVANTAKWGINYMIGVTTFGTRAIAATWRLIPAAIADAFVSAANYAIDGINNLIRMAVGGVNAFIDTVNPLLDRVGLGLPKLGSPQLGQIKNNFTGAGAELGKAFAGAVKDTIGKDFLGDMADAVSPYAQARARSRMAADAKGGKGSKSGGSKGAGKSANDNEETKFSLAKPPSINLPDASQESLVGQLSANLARKQDAEAATVRGRTLQAFHEYGAEIADVGKQAFDAWGHALKGTEDALVNFATTGKLNFKSLANSIIADIARIAIQQAIMKPLTSWLGGLFGNGAAFSGGNVVASANGNAFSGGNVTAFAGGGVVARPTLFPMAGGKTGLMGEAGAEAIMPLRRLGNGRLGVEAAGGGVQNVVVNVDASGNQQVQGNQDKAAALGNAISAAVRAELIQQKRPGGLLAA